MAQLFKPTANLVAWASTFGLLALITVALAIALTLPRSDYVTGVKMAVEQPIPFSHKHHVEDIGMDCRFCHQSVESSPFAGMPTTETCMKCHGQIWTDAPMLQPVRQSWQTGEPLNWARVHDLPDFVYFNHAVHVNNGIGCVSCHGRVDQMSLTSKSQPLLMRWCLDCHRNPEKFIRPADRIYDFQWTPPAGDPDYGLRLVQSYGILTQELTHCTTCHR